MDVCEIDEDATAKPGEPHKRFYPPATRPGFAQRGGWAGRPPPTINCFLFGEFSHFLDLKFLISIHTKGFFSVPKKKKKTKKNRPLV